MGAHDEVQVIQNEKEDTYELIFKHDLQTIRTFHAQKLRSLFQIYSGDGCAREDQETKFNAALYSLLCRTLKK